MIKLVSKDDKILWKRAGLQKPAPTDEEDRRFKLALKDCGLPPVKDRDKVVIE